jgi:hypothetical protein
VDQDTRSQDTTCIFGPDIELILEGMCRNLLRSVDFTTDAYDRLFDTHNDMHSDRSKLMIHDIDRAAIVTMICFGFVCCCSPRIQK